MSRRRALLLTTRMPWPLDDGGRIGCFQSTWSLAQAFDVTMLVMVPPEEVASPVPAVFSELGIRVVRVAHRPAWGPIAAVRGIFGRWPYTLARYRNANMDREIRRRIAAGQPDLIFLTSLHLATYFDAFGEVPCVLRQQNAEALWMSRYAASLGNPLARAYASIQARRLGAVEPRLCERMDLVLAVQPIERDLLRVSAPRARIELTQVGIDFSRFGPRRRSTAHRVLIVGSFAWEPNVQGLMRFLGEGWSRLRERMPDVHLRVVGKAPPPALVEACARTGVELAGYVDSMEVEFSSASLLLVPLWVGAGARVKIIEAMAARLPVVSTPLGAEGLGVRHQTHFLEAETPAGLADAAADLLGNPAMAASLAESAWQHARAEFSLEAAAEVANRLCESVLVSPDAAQSARSAR